MKLIVQVPCLNEEKTLPLVINSIPKEIPGVDTIETMIIDDGSTDKTIEVARKLRVTHIIKNKRNRGLAHTFATGIHEALKRGADIIVNTDGDNQYPQEDIGRLVSPIIKGNADIVIANRQTDKIEHFSAVKKLFQKFGSYMVRLASNTDVPDAVSGFRAYSREAALNMNIVTDFSYVIETIIQSEYKRIAIESIDIDTNAPTRKSRLFSNMLQHMIQSGSAIVRIFTMYRPLFVFVTVGIATALVGSVFGLRFLYFFLLGDGAGHIQSLIFSAILITVGFQIAMTGLVADLIGLNRKLLEDVLRRMKTTELTTGEVKKIIQLPNGVYKRKEPEKENDERRIYA